MRRFLMGLTLIAPLFAFAENAAENNLRAGLWQITTSSDLLRLAPHVQPEQMKNIKELANEYGFELPQIENGAAISQACITQEMAAQKTLPNFYKSQLACTSKQSSRDGNNYKVDFVCASDTFKGNGTATGNITNPEAFTGQTNFIGQAQGIAVNEKADISGKWLNASCGLVKPL